MAEMDATKPEQGGRELGTEVVRTVAREKECDPLDLPPLHDAIDPAALERLFAPTTSGRRRDGQVTFTYCDFTVRVDRDGRIRVDPVGGE